MHMLVLDFTKSRGGERIGKARTERTSQRAKARMRTVPEIAATFSILVLIMIGALAARLLPSLPNGAVH
jgi:uncharacterized membrane protein